MVAQPGRGAPRATRLGVDTFQKQQSERKAPPPCTQEMIRIYTKFKNMSKLNYPFLGMSTCNIKEA